MIRLDVYRYGSGIRARLHDHQGERDDRCSEQCEEYSQQRAYPHRGASPAEQREAAMAAVVRALMDPALGHRFFLQLLEDGDRLEL